MIPILLLVGLVVGILPGWWRIAGVVAVGVASVLLFANDDLLRHPIDGVAVFGLAVVNTAAGAFITWLLKRLITTKPGSQP